jgi:hypothetical protein
MTASTLLMWLVGLAALWLLVKVGIHHLRGMSDTAVLQKQGTRLEAIAEVKALECDEKQTT